MIIIADKPSGMTSQQVVSRIKHAMSNKIKIGHTGTLDPICTGVLPVLTGVDTTLSDLFLSPKAYRASFLTGIVTDTQDITGTELERHENKITKADILRVIPDFIGEIEQIPPMYSAIKIGGQKLYNLAREGKTIERQPRKITIDSISLTGYDSENGFFIDVSCSKGTYIRTLCHDIGAALGCGACMTTLRRTASNGFSEKDAYSLEEIVSRAQSGTLEEISIESSLPFMHLDAVTVPFDGEKYYLNGGVIGASRLDKMPQVGKRFRAYSEQGAYLGLCECGADGIKAIWLKNR